MSLLCSTPMLVGPTRIRLLATILPPPCHPRTLSPQRNLYAHDRCAMPPPQEPGSHSTSSLLSPASRQGTVPSTPASPLAVTSPPGTLRCTYANLSGSLHCFPHSY